MSTSDSLEESTVQAPLTQTWGPIEQDHLQSHFRKHVKYWQRHPQKAAESCVRTWQQIYPDKTERMTVDKVIEYRKHVGKPSQAARISPAKHNAPVSDLDQTKRDGPDSQAQCHNFPPCKEHFMYEDGLVDHILRKHASQQSMSCDCGEAFTRRIDLRGHVELVHARDKLASILVSAKDLDSLEGQGQSDGPASLRLPPSTTDIQIIFRCSDFANCSKSFEDEQKFKDHVRSHKSWISRRAKQGGSSPRKGGIARIAKASTSSMAAKVTTTQLNSEQPMSEQFHGIDQEGRATDHTVEPGLTTTCSQIARDFINVASAEYGREVASKTTNAETGGMSGPSAAEETSQEISGQVRMWSNHLGMSLLPRIEEQLRRSVLKELEAAVVQALPDPRQISRHMQIITKSTSDVIAKILSPYQYASFIEHRATCLKDVTELSAIVFGDTREEEILNLAFGTRLQNKTNAETVLRAYTAAAVTQWVLRNDFRDCYEARGNVYNGPDIRRQSMEDFIKTASPDLYSILNRKHYHEFLQTELAPRLDCRSWQLADKLYHVLLRLFDGQVDEAWDGSHGADLRISLSNTVRSLLFQIFREAHKLCLLMHHNPVRYDIDFPTWPEKYVAEDMRPLEPQFPHSEGQVCICVCPRISHKDALETIVPAFVSLM